MAGPCNRPGYPSCKEEYEKMVIEQGNNPRRPLSDSYVDALLKVSDEFLDGGKTGGVKIVPGDIINATRRETNKRFDYIKGTNAYKRFVLNPNAGPVIKKFKKEFDVLEGRSKGYPADYQLPNEEELSGLNKLADKYAGSEDVNKVLNKKYDTIEEKNKAFNNLYENDLSFVDKIKAGIQGFKLSRQYPNLLNIANKKFKFK